MKGYPGFQVSRGVIRIVIGHTLNLSDRMVALTGLDIVRTLIFLAIGWENIRDGLLASPAVDADLSRHQLDARIPTSVYQVSRRLRLPYETVRRAVNELEAAGLCRRQDRGWIVPPNAPSAEAALEQARLGWHATEGLLRDLARTGIALPAAENVMIHDLEVRVTRLSVGHLLASLSVLRACLDVDMVSALLFLTINRANFVSVVTTGPSGLQGAGPDTVLADATRTPVSVYALSRQLRTPYETTRRHVAKLSAAGLCERTGSEGVIVPAAVIEGPRMRQAASASTAVLAEFLSRLAELGLAAPTPTPALHELVPA